MDEATYQTVHANGCPCREASDDPRHDQRCEHLGPVLEDVAKILIGGNFPVVELTKMKGSDGISISVEPYRKSVSYTAITHVWADGLGNPRSNTLPRCQCSRLYELLSHLSDRMEGLSLARNALSRFSKRATVYVWIDTLCIPHVKELRKQAINLMYSVYQKATKVLLLDESLLQVSSSRPLEELCFRITISPWMRRAWTLQEGALANTLFIQLADGPIHVQSAIDSLARRAKGTESYNITLMESCIILQYLESCRLGVDESQVTIVHSGLIDRSTSHEEDKKLCLAIMLGCNMQRIQEAKGEERTKRIYEQMQYIPDSFFWHRHACLSIQGFSWAPKNIWHAHANGSMARNRLQMRNGRLQVKAPSVVYRSRSHYVSKQAHHIRDVKSEKWYTLMLHENEPFEQIASQSRAEWTTLAVILKAGVLASSQCEGIVISLDWAQDTDSLSKSLETINSPKQEVKGSFVGRALFVELDQKATAKLASMKATHKDIEQMRADIRSGKQSIEDMEEVRGPTLRRMLLEDDDSWWVFDGVVLNETSWSIR